MTTTVLVGGRLIALSPEDAIATGGEATVHAVDALAIKLWHAPSPARARKIDALLARRGALPRGLVAPEAAVHDPATGAIVGFAMPRLAPSFEPLALLGLPAWRRARGVRLATVARVFVALITLVDELHRAGIVVGDLSDQNVLCDVEADDPVRLVDADSVQVDGHPCLVATEAFLDPHLYGPDPSRPCATAGGVRRTFGVESDHYAILTLLFRSLALVHPYGGTVDTLPSLPRRALARVSVLRGEVVVPPRVRQAIDLLPAALVRDFTATFERGERPPPTAAAVAAYAASLLPCGCGLEIPVERLPCPRCAAASPRVAAGGRPGGVATDVVLEARGPVVAVAAGAGVVVAVAIEGGLPVLHLARGGRRARHAIAADPCRAGWDVAVSTSLVAVTPRGGDGSAGPVTLLALQGGAPVRIATSAERARGDSAMAVADDTIFRVARGTILAGRVAGGHLVERAVATVIARQTRLHGVVVAGAPSAVALGRVLGTRQWALVTPAGSHALDAPPMGADESVLDEVALGDGEGVVVVARTRLAGRDVRRVTRFDHRGRRTADRVTAADDATTPSPGAALHGRLLAATDGGLVREDVASGAITRFEATEPHVERGAAIAIAPGGVLVAQGRVVRLLRAT